MSIKKKLFDAIVIGELNVDLILHQPEAFPQLEKEILADNLTLTMGSSSAIFAANLASLGTKVAFVGKLGNDTFANLIEGSLNNANVDTRFIKRDPQLKTGVTVILTYGEQRAMITYPGAMSYLTIADIDEKIFQKARHLHVSSFFLQKGMRKDFRGLFLNAKNSGLSTSLDPQWDPDEEWDEHLKNTLPFVDIFLPNFQEAQCISGKADPKEALRYFSQWVSIPVIKMGTTGAMALKNDEIYFSPSYQCNAVDAVGAGDSFNAGFVYGYLSGLPVLKCLQIANACGALSTTKPGGTDAFTDSRKVWDFINRLLEQNCRKMRPLDNS